MGETERQLRDRMKEHMAAVRLNRKTPVSRPFNEEGSGVDMVKKASLDRIVGSSRYYGLIREKEGIDRLKTGIPLGVNKKAALEVLWREF